MKHSILAIVVLSACGSNGSTEDWTKAKTKQYRETVEGVTFSIEMPEGRTGRPDTQQSGWDYWLSDARGYSPTAAISVRSYADVLDDDLEYRRLKSDGDVVAVESFENGYAYTAKDRDGYSAFVVLNLGEHKSIACRAIAGNLPIDKQVAAKLPALEAICRTLQVDGIGVVRAKSA
ncbi:MAG TPA: hypothetical protein VIV11_11345 [Kofleriaceae bacterium]